MKRRKRWSWFLRDLWTFLSLIIICNLLENIMFFLRLNFKLVVICFLSLSHSSLLLFIFVLYLSFFSIFFLLFLSFLFLTFFIILYYSLYSFMLFKFLLTLYVVEIFYPISHLRNTHQLLLFQLNRKLYGNFSIRI